MPSGEEGIRSVGSRKDKKPEQVRRLTRKPVSNAGRLFSQGGRFRTDNRHQSGRSRSPRQNCPFDVLRNSYGLPRDGVDPGRIVEAECPSNVSEARDRVGLEEDLRPRGHHAANVKALSFPAFIPTTRSTANRRRRVSWDRDGRTTGSPLIRVFLA